MPRVVFVVLDAFPPDAVDPDRTPTLHRLAASGHWWPAGGPGVLPALTYPAHATFVTGRSPIEHGLVANEVWRSGEWVRADKVGPEGPTIFDALTAAGRRSLAVVGDHHLINVCAADRATVHWPEGGRFPKGHERSITGYLRDDAVIEALTTHDPAEFDLVFVQLDEVDAHQHLYGPGSDEALVRLERTDAALGRIVEWLDPVWDDSVVIVVSDHHQESTTDEVLDLGVLPGHLVAKPQGTIGLALGNDPGDLASLPGIAGAASLADDVHLVWGAAGARIGPVGYEIPGDHGSPRTSRQLTVVGGGHPNRHGLIEELGDEPDPLAWAPAICRLVGADLSSGVVA